MNSEPTDGELSDTLHAHERPWSCMRLPYDREAFVVESSGIPLPVSYRSNTSTRRSCKRSGERADIMLTLNTYSHVSPTMQAEAAAKVDELLTPIEVTEELRKLKEPEPSYAIYALDGDRENAV